MLEKLKFSGTQGHAPINVGSIISLINKSGAKKWSPKQELWQNWHILRKSEFYTFGCLFRRGLPASYFKFPVTELRPGLGCESQRGPSWWGHPGWSRGQVCGLGAPCNIARTRAKYTCAELCSLFQSRPTSPLVKDRLFKHDCIWMVDATRKRYGAHYTYKDEARSNTPAWICDSLCPENEQCNPVTSFLTDGAACLLNISMAHGRGPVKLHQHLKK